MNFISCLMKTRLLQILSVTTKDWQDINILPFYCCNTGIVCSKLYLYCEGIIPCYHNFFVRTRELPQLSHKLSITNHVSCQPVRIREKKPELLHGHSIFIQCTVKHYTQLIDSIILGNVLDVFANAQAISHYQTRLKSFKLIIEQVKHNTDLPTHIHKPADDLQRVAAQCKNLCKLG